MRCLAGDLDAVALADPGIAFADDLDFEPLDQWPTRAVQLAQLVLGGVSDLVGDANAPSPQDKLHTAGV